MHCPPLRAKALGGMGVISFPGFTAVFPWFWGRNWDRFFPGFGVGFSQIPGFPTSAVRRVIKGASTSPRVPILPPLTGRMDSIRPHDSCRLRRNEAADGVSLSQVSP